MTQQNPKFDRDFSILILAGGRGERLGGRDKGLLPLAGRPVVEQVLERVRQHAQPILISANRNLDSYASYGYPVIEDTLAAFPGPLAGMLAGLDACRSGWLLVLPVDSPLVSADYPRRMLESAAQAPTVQACVAQFRDEPEPVFCLLQRSLRASLRDYLSGGQRSVRDWMQTIDARRVDFSDCPEQFININQEADLQKLERHLQARGAHESAV